MKPKNIVLQIMALLLLCLSCDRDEWSKNEGIDNNHGDTTTPIPDGYFVVSFTPSTSEAETRAPVVGSDTRVQHIKYIIYKSTGEYVKEKNILLPSQGIPTWPLTAVSDTLPKGSYKVVFLGNTEKTLFPYSTGESPQNFDDVLINYQSNYSDARILLPPTEFTGNTEYYWDNETFSDISPNPNILLQRIIGSVRLQRVFIDGEDALNMLVNNIVTQIAYKDLIRNNVQAALPNLLTTAISPILGSTLSGLLVYVDDIVNPLVDVLVEPLTELLYQQLLQQLVAQIGIALLGNSDRNALVEYLGILVNPWNNLNASNAVVAINNYPRLIDFDLNVKEYFTGVHNFKYGFNTESLSDDRYLLLKNFNAPYDVRKISVVGSGLIAGVIVDQLIDDFLLPGAFVDINDPILISNEKSNRRFQSRYSLLAIRLINTDHQPGVGNTLTLSAQIGQIANIDNILRSTLTIALNALTSIPILGPALIPLINGLINNLLSPIKGVNVVTTINLPLLGIENLTLSGSWGPITAY